MDWGEGGYETKLGKHVPNFSIYGLLKKALLNFAGRVHFCGICETIDFFSGFTNRQCIVQDSVVSFILIIIFRDLALMMNNIPYIIETGLQL